MAPLPIWLSALKQDPQLNYISDLRFESRWLERYSNPPKIINSDSGECVDVSGCWDDWRTIAEGSQMRSGTI